MNKYFAKEKSMEPLPHQYFSHKTILLRKLKDVDMWLQENKVINLKIATRKVMVFCFIPVRCSATGS